MVMLMMIMMMMITMMMKTTPKEMMMTLVYLCVLGVKPIPGTHKNWKMKRLQSKPLKGLEKESTKTAEQMMNAAALNKKRKLWNLFVVSNSVQDQSNLNIHFVGTSRSVKFEYTLCWHFKISQIWIYTLLALQDQSNLNIHFIGTCFLWIP